jgi:uncharacterized protein
MSLPPPSPDATVLVTGASAGIGTELARELAGRGYGVTLVARRRERLDELAEALRADQAAEVRILPCDLSDPAARRGLLDELGAGARTVAGVCNNAGFGAHGPLHGADLRREAEMVRLNVEALHELTGAFLPDMVERGAGAVLNVASVAAFQPVPGMATYAATKAFVLAFSEAVHAELAGTGVSCTTLCPGLTRTEFQDVAGFGEAEAGPDFVWMTAAEVARAGVEAMTAGRRSMIPGLVNRATAAGGRFVPRSVLLPLARRVGTERFVSRG